MTRLQPITVPHGVQIRDLTVHDVALLDISEADVATLIRYIKSKRRQPRHSTTVRGLRLIKGNRP